MIKPINGRTAFLLIAFSLTYYGIMALSPLKTVINYIVIVIKSNIESMRG